MQFAKRGAIGAIVLATFVGAAHAQPADQDHAAHHLGQGAAVPAQSPPEPAGSTGMPVSGPAGEMPMMKGMRTGQPGSPGTSMTGGDMQPMMRMMQMMRERMAEHMGGGMIPLEHVKGHIAFLKAELGITDAQEPQWSAFADALQTQAQTMRTMHEQMMKGGMPSTWPDRLAHEEQMLSARLAAVKAIEAPARALYSALSPEQQKKADELLGRPMGMM